MRITYVRPCSIKVRMCDALWFELSADDKSERSGQIGYQTFPMIGQYGRLRPRARLHMGHSVAKRSVQPDLPKSAKGAWECFFRSCESAGLIDLEMEALNFTKGITATGPSVLSIDHGPFNLGLDIRGITQRGVRPRGCPRTARRDGGDRPRGEIDPDMIGLNRQFLVAVNRIPRDEVRCHLGNQFFYYDLLSSTTIFYQAKGR